MGVHLAEQTEPSGSWRDKIRTIANDRGISLARLARIVGVTPGRMSLWVGPKRQGEPGVQEWVKLAKALNMPLEYLMDDCCEEPPSFGGMGAEEQRYIRHLIEDLGFEESKRRLLGLKGSD